MRTRRVDLERQIKEKTMGRPLNKRYFGTIANADGGTMPNGDAAFNVTVAADVGNGIEVKHTESGFHLIIYPNDRNTDVAV